MYSPTQTYPTYSPQSYSVNPNQQFQSMQPQSNGIIWVQGESGAKSFIVNPGQAALLMDSEDSVFYIKSCDMSGMPMPLRTFDYSERQNQKSETNQIDYITREEFEKRLAEVTNANTKQFVSTAKSK